MTAPIPPELQKDCLMQILSFFPPQKREHYNLVCKIFDKAVKDPFFEKERTEAKHKQKEIAKVISHYPKELVTALGGPQKLYDLPAIDLTKEDVKTFFDGKHTLPSRGKSAPFILFQYKSTLPAVQDNVYITLTPQGWKWHAGVIKCDRNWSLTDTDFDYIRRLFNGEPCGFRGGIEGRETIRQYDGKSNYVLINKT